MFLGNERKGKFGIDWDRTYHEAEEHMSQVGLKDSATTLIKDIGTGKQQLVEIAKALSKNVKLLILDEPTSSLNEEDSRMLLNLLLEFKKQGMTSIIISHKLNEIAYVADKITVVRDGATIETIDNAKRDIDEDRIIQGMVGRELSDRYPSREHKVSAEVGIEVRDWNVYHPVYTEKKVVNNISFNVHRGEIVGFSGLQGAGRTAGYVHFRACLRHQHFRPADHQRQRSEIEERARSHRGRPCLCNGRQKGKRSGPERYYRHQ